MGKILAIFVLVLSIAAVAQVSVVNGTATNTAGAPAPQNVPLLSPPNVALPGSGTPTGVPPQLGVNDARSNNAGGAVYHPSAGTAGVRMDDAAGGLLINTPMASPQGQSPGGLAPAENSNGAQATATQGGDATQNATIPTVPSAIVVRRFANETQLTSERATSLGELARQLQPNRRLAKRKFENQDLASLTWQNAGSAETDLPQSDIEGNAAAKPQADRQIRGSERVLDPKDLRAVEEAVRRSNQKKQQQEQQPK